jgi:CBS domain
MDATTAKDLMVPLEEYPTVDSRATVLEAVMRLDESRRKSSSVRKPFLAVLVTDANANVVGKMGQVAILKALEPRSQVIEDQDTLERAGVSDAIMRTALDHRRVLGGDFSGACQSAAAVPVRTVMTPLRRHIDVTASMREVIHHMVDWQTLSLLVTEEERPVGLVRLSDLCDEVIDRMRHPSCPSED